MSKTAARKSTGRSRRSPRAKSTKRTHRRRTNSRWVAGVKTVSTFPPKETFNRPAREVARIMADPKISPKGLGSAIRMVQYFINRGGKGLSKTRKAELEKAKHLLQKRKERD